MKPPSIDIAAFAERQLELLGAELNAELAETALLTSTHAPPALARAGLALLNLHVSSQRTGFGGKTILELAVDPALTSRPEDGLPEHDLRVGDICSIAEQPRGSERKKERASMEERGARGVVTKLSKDAIHVALDKEDADVPTTGRLWLVKLANDVTFKRLSHTMTRLRGSPSTSHTILTQTLFNHLSLPTPTPLSPSTIPWHNPHLNPSQRAAITQILSSTSPGSTALIHGPPGTGKTHTLIELILHLHARNLRVLVCGPSNIAVDNIVERLAPHKIPMTRLGHPARLLPGVLAHSIEVQSRTSEAAAVVADVRGEMDAKQASVRKARSGAERRGIYGELRELRKEFREREGRVMGNLVRAARVVLCTLHGAGGRQVREQRFDVVIVDEASQALEAQCWIPILESGAERLVLAGDHLQLGPTIKSTNVKTKKGEKKVRTKRGGKEDAEVSVKQGVKDLRVDDTKDGREFGVSRVTLETTLFDRLLATHGNKIKCMLKTQYRMHENIMAFPSVALYDNELIAAEEVKSRLLSELPYDVETTDDTREPLIFWDTQGGEFPEKTEEDDESSNGGKNKHAMLADSKVNPGEVSIVHTHVLSLITAGVKPEDIAVVTPYNGQLSLLARKLREKFPGLELGSIDGFQGREKEAIIVSLVRSNSEHEVGFLGEKRRLNVAMTRPKRQLCVVGDSETISSGTKYLKDWMQHLEEHADLRYPNWDDLAEFDQDQ